MTDKDFSPSRIVLIRELAPIIKKASKDIQEAFKDKVLELLGIDF